MDFFEREDVTFWKKILGNKIVDEIKKNPNHYLGYIRNNMKVEEKQFWSFCENYEGSGYDDKELGDEVFGAFYTNIINMFLCWKQHSCDKLDNMNIVKNMIRVLYNSIRDIPIRVYICDMQRLKRFGKLHGESIEEEYDFYCNNFLRDIEYNKKMFRDYSEMFRLLFVRLQYTYQFLTEIIDHFKEDKMLLEVKFCGGQRIQKIENIVIGCSDRHRRGKTVAVCILDNNIRLVYKPHNLKNEIAYRNLYERICKEIGISVKHYEIIDRVTYGWETYFEVAECHTERQICMYFRRLGIHLFQCYLLNGTDIHQENILAVGEFPVLLDVETLPGMRKKHDISTAEELINVNISESVLKTGILPVPIWKNENEGVIINAIHGREEAETSVKVPVIVKAKTSEMAIVYQKVVIKKGNSLPVIHGKSVEADKYTGWLKEGFTEAYRLWIKSRKEFEYLLEPFWECEVRYLFRHTQQYSMYLSSSLHPFFLQKSMRRLLMLQILRKSEEDELVVQHEIQEMYQMDIPFFTCYAKEKESRYQMSAYESYRDITSKMGMNDLKRQSEFIQIAMGMLNFENGMNQYFVKTKGRDYNMNIKEEEVLDKIVKKITKRAVFEGKDIGWMKLHAERNTSWQLLPIDMSLYDGIGGIAVFLAMIRRIGLVDEKGVFEKVVQKIIRYIDNGKKKDKKTGLLIGEGSMAYTCLLLYQISGQDCFERYAKKQAESLRNLYVYDESYDLLAGNAGAIILLIDMYLQFLEEKWLQLAIEIGDYLWGKAERQEKGYGWRNQKDCPPLAGVAHGNSGFIIAYAALLRHTHEHKYKYIIDELLAYENSLYSEKEGNWRDMRYPNQEAYGNAWCHGAAGILQARLKLIKLEEYAQNEIVLKDIDNAAKVLFEQSERKGMCICHGMAGNYRIMTEYAKIRKITDQQKHVMGYIKKVIMKSILEEDNLAVLDRYGMGLMTGIAGIGLAILE